MLDPVRILAQSVVDGILAEAVSALSLKAAMTAYTKELMDRATEAAKQVSNVVTKGGPLARPLVTPRPTISYLPHQETGIRWMLDREAPDAPFCRGGILGDDMGLGKTFQTIGLIKNSPPCKTLILCPPALLAGWTEELKACDLPVTGLTHLRDVGTVVATYNIAHLHAVDFRAAKFDRVILDEGHIIRNGKATKRWWTCMAIARKSPCRWILSATPVQNGAKDWINLCVWLKVKASPGQMPDLAPVIMLRRTMEDIRADPVLAGSVPPEPTFIRHGLSIPEGTEEGKLFRTLTDKLDTLMDTRHVSALLVLELYMRIQQFLVHPQLYIDSMRAKYKGAYHTQDWTGTATKFNAFTKVLQESDEPTIVFCNFRAEMDRVHDLAVSLGWKVWSIRGGMGSEAVGQAVKEAKAQAKAHNQNPTRVLIIVQIVAGGAGLNLQFCSRILFLSQHWNPAVVHQACGRAVRIGQTSSVHIHFFSIDDPVALNLDSRMATLHASKIAHAKQICSSLFYGFFQTA
jgi:SNF2 family DNA or RNA helicase